MITRAQIKGMTIPELQARDRLLSGDFFDSWLTMDLVRTEEKAEDQRQMNAWVAQQQAAKSQK